MSSATNTLPVWIILLSSVPCAAQPIMSLFDGQTLAGWQTVDGEPVTQGWEVVDESIYLRVDGPRAGNILTTRKFADFDLQFEWKIAAKGNSGVKYRVQKFGDRVLGCEYQVLDDAGYPALEANQWTGSLYGLYAPTTSPAKSAGEFNHSRIVVVGNHIQHWLNGELVVKADVGSSDWRSRKASSKFADVAGFGENHWGRIMLTDHNSEVWYWNLTLCPLVDPTCDLLLACRPTVARDLWHCPNG